MMIIINNQVSYRIVIGLNYYYYHHQHFGYKQHVFAGSHQTSNKNYKNKKKTEGHNITIGILLFSIYMLFVFDQMDLNIVIVAGCCCFS